VKRIALLLMLAAGCGAKTNDRGTARADQATPVASDDEPARAEPPAAAPAPPAREPASPARAEDDPPAKSGHAIVDAHNRYRAKHCAPPLVWSDKLAKVAQKWVDTLVKKGCAFEHSGSDYGENLAAGTAGAMSPDAVVDMWYREVDRYDFKHGGFSMDTGHFTQLVWKSTKRVGCGMRTCKGLDVWVCNYDPAGNWERQYRQNVLPTRCK